MAGSSISALRARLSSLLPQEYTAKVALKAAKTDVFARQQEVSAATLRLQNRRGELTSAQMALTQRQASLDALSFQVQTIRLQIQILQASANS